MPRFACSDFSMTIMGKYARIGHGAFIVEADSIEEAEAVAMIVCHKIHPESEGWRGHSVKVSSINIIITMEMAKRMTESQSDIADQIHQRKDGK
jgi:hypothetical protein